MRIWPWKILSKCVFYYDFQHQIKVNHIFNQNIPGPGLSYYKQTTPYNFPEVFPPQKTFLCLLWWWLPFLFTVMDICQQRLSNSHMTGKIEESSFELLCISFHGVQHPHDWDTEYIKSLNNLTLPDKHKKCIKWEYLWKI